MLIDNHPLKITNPQHIHLNKIHLIITTTKKTFGKVEIEGNVLNLLKGVYKNRVANITVNGERLQAKMRRKTGQVR